MKKNSRKSRMLYLMHVDWYWICQRPQFLAEELHKHFDLLVVYPRANARKTLQTGRTSPTKRLPLFHLPFEDKIPGLKLINMMIARFVLFVIIKVWKPDIVWISFPSQYPQLPKKTHYRLIYDCMDDYPAMAEGRKAALQTAEYEGAIVRKADRILASSNKLKHKLEMEYALSENSVTLLRNGFDGIIDKDVVLSNRGQRDKVFRIGYIGTVSYWFDWDVLARSLSDFSQIEYHIIGPIDPNVSAPKHDRILFHGTIEHEKLYSTVEKYDCLCMPFILNDIVEAVDPVKLYEYINFYKSIISVRYDEVLRFEKFVHFYSTYEEFRYVLQDVMGRLDIPKYSITDRENFLMESTWQSRAMQIMEALGDE